jgi:hypothetical protein
MTKMWEQVQVALNESTTRVVMSFARLLPGFVALVVAVLIASVFAWILRVALRRSLRTIRFDENMSRWGYGTVGTWSADGTPTGFVTRFVSWVIIFVGFLIGIAAFDATLTSDFVARVFRYLPNVFAALLILLVGNFVARFLARGVLISAVNMNMQYAHLLSLGVKWLVLVMTAAMALDHLGIGGSIVLLAFGILFGGIVLALALAVGLGSKELVSRSLERQATQPQEKVAETFRHF